MHPVVLSPIPQHYTASMVRPAGDGVALLYASIILLILAWLTMAARVGVRMWRKASGLDDLLMLIGLVRTANRHLFPKAND